MNRFLDALAVALLLALVVLVGLASRPARSQTPECVGLPDALAALATRYQEQPRMSGLTSGGVLMIITAADGGGWSVLLVTPDGQACMAASGASFEVLEPRAPGVDG